MKYPGNPIATTAAIIEREGNILLTRRAINPFKGFWCVPGGRIENGEPAMDSVKREVKEETGLDFKPRFFKYFDEILPNMDWYAVVLAFSGPARGQVRPNEEVSEWKWVKPEEALKHELAYINQALLKEWSSNGIKRRKDNSNSRLPHSI